MLSETEPSIEYRCCECGAWGCKLWRPFQDSVPELLCVDCAGKHEGKNVSDLDDMGRRLAADGNRTDQIGFYVPAAPENRRKWWCTLPNRPDRD